MKKPISVKLDESLWVFIKNKPNKSRYISELIKQDIQMQNTRPIVKAIREELLADEDFFQELTSRTKQHTSQRPIESPEVGYACCQKTPPCKHWQWDSVTGEGYINSITGERREA